MRQDLSEEAFNQTDLTMEAILTSLNLSGHPERYPEYTSFTRHVPQNPPTPTTTTNHSTQVVHFS
jgi:hypothetical protein